MTQLLELLDIADIWRIRHPSTKQKTRCEKTRFGNKQTRTDNFLISQHLGFTTKSVEILPSIKSNHSLLKLSLWSEGVAKQGRDWWKMNTSILSDNKYISLVSSTIKHAKTDLINLSNKDIAWDYIKCRICTESITDSIKKKTKSEKLLEKLTKQLEDLEYKITLNPCHSLFDELNIIKQNIEEIYHTKSAGCIICSRCRMVDGYESQKQGTIILIPKKR